FFLCFQPGDQRVPCSFRCVPGRLPKQVFQRVVPLVQRSIRSPKPFHFPRQLCPPGSPQPVQVRNVLAPQFPLKIIQQRHFFHAATSLLLSCPRRHAILCNGFVCGFSDTVHIAFFPKHTHSAIASHQIMVSI